MTMSIAVAGASGYAGGEVLRLLAAHPEAHIGALTAGTSAGEPLRAHHPHLRHLADRTLEPTDAARLADHDVVVMALPHGASAELTDQLADYGGIIIDCGADHRLTDADDVATYYGGAVPQPWPYGMPELPHRGETQASAQREQLTKARRIAAPGCNASAVTLAIQPGIAAGLIDADDIVATLAVGYSGAGKAQRPHLTAAHAAGNLQPYGVGGTHRHVPEVTQSLRTAGADTVRLSFTPVLTPVSRGILAVVSVPLTDGANPPDIRGAWEAAYRDEPVIDLLDEGQWPTTGQVTGAHSAAIGVGVDEGAGRVIAICAIDNLTKGTAGAAIQSLNLARGLDEMTGLSTIGVAP